MKSEVGRVFFLSLIVCHLVNTKKFHVSLHNGVNFTLDSKKAKEPNSPAAGEKGDYSVGLNFTTETEDAFDSYEDAKGKVDNNTESQNRSAVISKEELK